MLLWILIFVRVGDMGKNSTRSVSVEVFYICMILYVFFSKLGAFGDLQECVFCGCVSNSILKRVMLC